MYGYPAHAYWLNVVNVIVRISLIDSMSVGILMDALPKAQKGLAEPELQAS